MKKLLAFLNSDAIHTARKAIAAGVGMAAGLIVKQATSGQAVTESDLVYAVTAGLAAAALVYVVPNRVVIAGK